MSPTPTDPPVSVGLTQDRESADDPAFLDRAPEQPRETTPDPRRRPFRRRTRLAAVLFATTCVSVFLAGLTPGRGIEGFLTQLIWLYQVGTLRPDWPFMLTDGAFFCGCLMAILIAHEMGHFLQARRHRVPATLPFFLPLPISPFGTLGAVILQDGGKADRRKLFDIAVSGPLAGLLVTLPVACYGIATSRFGYFDPAEPRWGDPFLIRWIVQLFHGPYEPGQDILINAPLFAGWVGVFITALNLLPVGQSDGGHILYALVGRKAHYVAYGVLAAAVLWMAITRQYHYALIVVLVLVFGPRHPPTANDRAPLGTARILLGWLTLAFVLVGFTPTPII